MHATLFNKGFINKLFNAFTPTNVTAISMRDLLIGINFQMYTCFPRVKIFMNVVKIKQVGSNSRCNAVRTMKTGVRQCLFRINKQF